MQAGMQPIRSRFRLRRYPPIASLVMGEDKYPYMLMVLGLIENGVKLGGSRSGLFV